MQKKPHRLNQINKFIQQKFSEIVNQEMDLPAGILVTITKVKTSSDLRQARIGLSVYPTEQATVVFGALCRRLKYLKYLLHQQMSLKFSPEIKLYLDEIATKVFELEAILNKLKQARND